MKEWPYKLHVFWVPQKRVLEPSFKWACQGGSQFDNVPTRNLAQWTNPFILSAWSRYARCKDFLKSSWLAPRKNGWLVKNTKNDAWRQSICQDVITRSNWSFAAKKISALISSYPDSIYLFAPCRFNSNFENVTHAQGISLLIHQNPDWDMNASTRVCWHSLWRLCCRSWSV